MRWFLHALTIGSCLAMTGCGGCEGPPKQATLPTTKKKDEPKPVPMPVGAVRIKIFSDYSQPMEHQVNEWIEAENPDIVSMHCAMSNYAKTLVVQYRVTKAPPAPKQ
ncbi:MAG: hypothetical protein KBC95_03700 [Candidatus Peribacteraceae bacterium]|nr:hypothetical protein [Candidatus Peribacteraceae bacterium]